MEIFPTQKLIAELSKRFSSEAAPLLEVDEGQLRVQFIHAMAKLTTILPLMERISRHEEGIIEAAFDDGLKPPSIDDDGADLI